MGRERVLRDPTRRIDALRRYRPEEGLTQTQIQYVQGLINGRTRDEIADDLNIKMATLRLHENNIVARMGEIDLFKETREQTANRVQRGIMKAVVKAALDGLVDSSELTSEIAFIPSPDEIFVWRRLTVGERPEILAKKLERDINVPELITALYEKLGIKNEFQAAVICIMHFDHGQLKGNNPPRGI